MCFCALKLHGSFIADVVCKYSLTTTAAAITVGDRREQSSACTQLVVGVAVTGGVGEKRAACLFLKFVSLVSFWF